MGCGVARVQVKQLVVWAGVQFRPFEAQGVALKPIADGLVTPALQDSAQSNCAMSALLPAEQPWPQHHTRHSHYPAS